MRRFLPFLVLFYGIAFGQYKLTIQFQQMDAHVGQLLEIRVVDMASGQETGRSFIESIPSANFEHSLYAIQPGQTYEVDFYADFNQNGQYDPPPADHAYRVKTGVIEGDTEVTFVHNLSFFDIDFPDPVSLADQAGVWKGMWDNPTFTVEGNIEGTLDVNENGVDVTADWQSWGLFGDVLPMSFKMVGTIGPEPYQATFEAQDPWSGTLNFDNGRITGKISYLMQGIDADVFGNYGDGQMVAFYDMTSINAVEYAIVHPQENSNVAKRLDQNNIDTFKLYPNSPNPFNPVTTIRYVIPEANYVSLRVFDISGREVMSLVNREQMAGAYSLTLDASELSSGVYTYLLVSGEYYEARKFVLMR